VDEYTKALAAAGLPRLLAEVVADTSFAAKRGDWYTERTDLQRLLGRPGTPLIDVVAATLKRNGISTMGSNGWRSPHRTRCRRLARCSRPTYATHC